MTTTPNAANDVRYFWDLISPVARFAILNQTQISQLPFNVTLSLQSNLASMNWTQLPANVQSTLLNQPVSSLLSLTYQQWGWADASNTFANTTLLSLLSSSVQSNLANVYILLAPLAYDSQIDLTALNQTLSASLPTKPYQKQPRNLVKKFLESFFEFFEDLLPGDGGRYKRGPFRPNYRAPTARSTFSNAIQRVQVYLRSLGFRCD